MEMALVTRPPGRNTGVKPMASNFASFPVDANGSSLSIQANRHAGEFSNKQAVAGRKRTTLSANKHGIRTSRRCIQCWYRRRKCKYSVSAVDARCDYCRSFRVPAHVCTRTRLSEFTPFDKWKDEAYERLFTNACVLAPSSEIQIQLGHYVDGPILELSCSQFVAERPHQVYALRKNQSGWHSVPTTAFCLNNSNADIASYTKKCVTYALEDVFKSNHHICIFFRIAQSYAADSPLIQDCLEMFAVIRLLRVGWKFRGHETLGMSPVKDATSAWYDTIPVPRMIQNQLNHLLELHIATLDRRILEVLQKKLRSRDRHFWLIGTLVVFLLLHVRELDAGRIIFWSRYQDTSGYWIHPSKPSGLISEAVASCDSILWHYICSIGQKPLGLNWDTAAARQMVDNDSKTVESMKLLQRHVQQMRNSGLIGLKASDIYQDGNPASVTFTISSLLFSTKAECKVRNFE